MLTRALHAAAALGDADAVEALLARGADPTACGADGRTAAQRVPTGDPSCDPEDVVAWRQLHRRLEAAAARVACVTLHAPANVIAGPLRVWVAREAPSPLDQGGGQLRVDVSPLTPGCLLLRLAGDYHGTSPGADPPWSLRAEVEVAVDDDGQVLTAHRRRWTTI
jgi:hypothetical protein